MNKNVSLKINGQEIPLNAFVKEVVANVVKGIVDSLDKIPENRNKIEIIIEEEKK
jgi:hypothetical protein